MWPLEFKLLGFNPVNLAKIEDPEYMTEITNESLDSIVDGLSWRWQAGDDSKETKFDSDIDEGIKIVTVPKYQLYDYSSKSSNDDNANNPPGATPIPADHMTGIVWQHTKLERLNSESILKWLLWSAHVYQALVRDDELKLCEERIFKLETQNIHTNGLQPLILECNMMERWCPYYPNSYRPYEERKFCHFMPWNVAQEKYSWEKGRNSCEWIDRLSNKSQINTECPRPYEMKGATNSRNDHEKLLSLLKELNKAGEISLKTTPSISTVSHDKIKAPTTHPSLVVNVPEDILKSIDVTASRWEVYKAECHKMEAFHREQFQLLKGGFKRIHADATMITQYTNDLLKNFKKSTSTMYRWFDAIDIHQQQAADTAYMIKDVLLRIHNDLFSLNDYFVAMNELLHGALMALAQETDRSEPHFAAFKLNIQLLFHQWNEISPVPSYLNAWAMEIINIVGEKQRCGMNKATKGHSTPISATPFVYKNNKDNSEASHYNTDESKIAKQISKGKQADVSFQLDKQVARDHDSAEAYMLAGQFPTMYKS